MSFIRLSTVEAIALLRAQGQRKAGPHAFTQKILHWLYCGNCGLVALKNDASRKAARAACAWEE